MSVSLAQAGLSVAAGSLTTLSPCVFPLLPLVLGSAVGGQRLAPVAMGLGMVAAFASIGVALGLLGPVLGIDSDHVRTGGALLLLGFAVVMLMPALGRRFAGLMTPIASAADGVAGRLGGGASVSSAFALGAVLGLVWSPCSGPLLASALTLAASEGGVASGALLLGLFGLGAATPLVAVAYASQRGFAQARTWLLSHGAMLQRGFAALLGLVGLAILTGLDKRAEAVVLGWLPDTWVRLTVMF